MGGVQIENLLSLMETSLPYNRAAVRREIADYLNNHLVAVATELEERGEAVIQTSSGSFRLTKEDLAVA